MKFWASGLLELIKREWRFWEVWENWWKCLKVAWFMKTLSLFIFAGNNVLTLPSHPFYPQINIKYQWFIWLHSARFTRNSNLSSYLFVIFEKNDKYEVWRKPYLKPLWAFSIWSDVLSAFQGLEFTGFIFQMNLSNLFCFSTKHHHHLIFPSPPPCLFSQLMANWMSFPFHKVNKDSFFKVQGFLRAAWIFVHVRLECIYRL